jgi:hypothetical protein
VNQNEEVMEGDRTGSETGGERQRDVEQEN